MCDNGDLLKQIQQEQRAWFEQVAYLLSCIIWQNNGGKGPRPTPPGRKVVHTAVSKELTFGKPKDAA